MMNDLRRPDGGSSADIRNIADASEYQHFKGPKNWRTSLIEFLHRFKPAPETSRPESRAISMSNVYWFLANSTDLTASCK